MSHMNTNDADISEKSQRGLAAGVLKQAAQDLRRFQCASNNVERELYYDAYSWLISNDDVWPFSFLNVCQTLNLTPEDVRHELMGDVSAGTSRYLLRRCARVARRCGLAIGQFFKGQFNTEPSGDVLSNPAPNTVL